MGLDGRGRRAHAPAQARRAQIVEAAARLLLEQGYLPLAPMALAKAVGVSKASIYNYFPDQHDLANAVLEQDFRRLFDSGLEVAAGQSDLAEAAAAVGDVYQQHVAARGPVAHHVLRDPFMAGRIRGDLAARRDRIMRRLARLARRELGLSAREAVAALNLGLTIPEEAGRLVWRGEISPAAGEALNRRLIAAALQALRP